MPRQSAVRTGRKPQPHAKKVATVTSKGVVTGKSAGHATITVTTANGLQDTVDLEVKDVTAPTSVELVAKETTLKVKGKLQLEAKMTSESGKVKTKLKWTTSDKKVATVSGKGLVTGKKAGEAIITVTTANGLSATINITVE